MLTTLEANFVQEYKVCGNATKALRNAGVDLPDRSLKVKACRMMKKPEVRAILEQQHDNLMKELSKPAITIVNQKVISLPSKEEYAATAWKRSSDDSTLKPDLKHKYFETAGKTLGHLRNADDNAQHRSSVTLILNELSVLNISAPDLPIEPSLPDSTNTAPNIIDVT